MHINIYKCIINLINSVTATISFVPNVAGDLPDLQAPPQPCSIKNKTDSDNTVTNAHHFIFTRLNPRFPARYGDWEGWWYEALCQSCRFPCQQRVLKLCPGHLCSKDVIV